MFMAFFVFLDCKVNVFAFQTESLIFRMSLLNIVLWMWLCVISSSIGGAIRPEVTFTPNWGNVLLGDEVTLTCNVMSTVPEEPRTYHWYKDGRTIYGDEQIVQINSSAEWDEGDYQCQINTGDISDPVTLKVTNHYVLLQIPLSAIYEGDPLALRCHHHKDLIGFQTIFYKNNEEIKSQFPDSEFRIQKVDLNTAGYYKCSKEIESSDSSGSYEFSDEVSVSVKELFSPPEIKVTPSRVIEGDKMTMRCHTRLDRLRGGTELHFAFYRDGWTVRGYNVSDIYRVRSSQLEDSGKYTCEVRTASNTVWKMSDEIYIQIYGEDVNLKEWL
ncbi:hypothetical protein AB205_0212940 [Aquarana catesbeiana]|uniref:Ig-like domain-containing protein n=1 Tax=Aquarana catesbeiana TaxID=8400 RepID=A0A2G9R668_AQUCT|nr:hypothetical protein AB205_0212940 [Aquarana catesbeiana]